MSVIASLIIPTHNRASLLIRMLDRLEHQTYPREKFEVIIVADGCTDDTVQQVSNHKAGFSIRLCELPGLGAASARNKGARIALGSVLLFADDDMEPGKTFISEHLSAHTSDLDVVIGYSPLQPEQRSSSMQRIMLREWWEEKFQAMRHAGHRFKYDDLTSGNFSVSAALFKKLNGFDPSFLCREDYEFGFRLMKAGGQFHFAYGARALHRDEVTDLQRSLQRKKMEGAADIQIKKKHPDFFNKEAVFYLSQHSLSKSLLMKGIQFSPALFDLVGRFAIQVMYYAERLNLLTLWPRVNYRLHQYWYLRGLMQGAGSSGKLHQLINAFPQLPPGQQKLKIDVQQDLGQLEQQLDQVGPMELDIFYGTKKLGNIVYEAGAEPIKGKHLRKILKDRFYIELSSILYPQFQIHKQNDVELPVKTRSV